MPTLLKALLRRRATKALKNAVKKTFKRDSRHVTIKAPTRPKTVAGVNGQCQDRAAMESKRLAVPAQNQPRKMVATIAMAQVKWNNIAKEIHVRTGDGESGVIMGLVVIDRKRGLENV